MMKFEDCFRYKLIYIIECPYPDHAGILKIGETTLKTDIEIMKRQKKESKHTPKPLHRIIICCTRNLQFTKIKPAN